MNGNDKSETSGARTQVSGGYAVTDQQLRPETSQNTDGAKKVAQIVYALQAVAFFVGITSLVALIINYVKLADVRGTWLESHFRWQIRTFWFAVLWSVVGMILVMVYIGWLVLLATAGWYIYRIVKGWLNLVDNKSMY